MEFIFSNEGVTINLSTKLLSMKSKGNSLPFLICSHHLAFFVTSLESLHKKQDKLLDALLKLQESNQLDTHLKTNQIKAISMDIFSGGAETKATTIE
ncbi:hypothetical protein NC652_033767 [Populus alba x Populus x berolinensis]|nr:hypothetical protein NC652_033767 [Populus alba x Populus x berolinensis]